MSRSSLAKRTSPSWRLAPAALALAACTGTVSGGGEGAPGADVPSMGAPGVPGSTTGTPGDGAGFAAGAAPPQTPPQTTAATTPAPASAASPTCKPGSRSTSPARVWRLSGPQYLNALRGVHPALAKTTVLNPVAGLDGAGRFRNEAEHAALPGDAVGQVLQSATSAANAVVPALMQANPCLAQLDAACVKAALAPVLTRAFRRPAASDELERYAALVRAGMPDGPTVALSVAIQAMLASPQFLYRWEIGEAVPGDPAGLRRLKAHEVASALSFTLTDAPPDETLLAAAAQNALATAEQVRAHAVRLLGTAADNKPLMRFFREYFHYDDAPAVTKDPKLFPLHKPEALVADTDQFVRAVVAGKKDVLQTLLTAGWGFAQPATTASYGLPAAAKGAATEPVRAEYPARQRAGLLTQPSFLSAFSLNTDTDPVRRGKFVAQNLLCVALPDEAPPNVPALPELPNATMRQKLRQHSTSAGCPVCHDLMDPPGLALEAYDHVGRFRTTDVDGKPVDTTGGIAGTGTPLDGPVKDASELMTKLAASPVVQQCFVRHSLRYWLGRNELASDGCAVNAAVDALNRSGGDVGELVVALVTSDAFLYRTAP